MVLGRSNLVSNFSIFVEGGGLMSADKILTFIEGCCKLNYFNAIISFRISTRNLTN